MWSSMLAFWLVLVWLMPGVSGTSRQGRNGERFRPGRPQHQQGRDERRKQHGHGESVHRLVLDIRTNEGPARKQSRRRRRRSSSSTSSSSQSRKAKKSEESKELARLRALLAKKEDEEKRRESQQKQEAEEERRRKEFEEFQNKVFAMLPKPVVAKPEQEVETEPKHGFWSPKSSQKASLFVHEIVDFTGCTSWDDVEGCLKQVSNAKLKELLQRKHVHNVPVSKPAVVKSIVRLLRSEFASAK